MLKRREFLMAAPAVLTLARALPAWAAAPGTDPFSGGVASGDPAPDGFVLWTRLAPEPLAEDGLGGMRAAAEVRWEVAADEAMREVVASGRTEANAAMGFSVHAEVTGLKPGRPYWYRFTAMGAQSPIGRAVTSPAEDASPDRLRFGFVSCANYETGFFSAYRHLAEERPDVVFFLGDYIYEYSYPATRPGGVARRHGVREAEDLAGYRQRYAQYRTDPDLQALHALAPCVATWDDHEVENDYGDDLSQIGSVAPEVFLRRRAAAYRAFYEHMPIRRARFIHDAMKLHRTVRWGRLAEFFVLDTRQHRSPMACLAGASRRARVVEAGCAGRSDPGRTMLGLKQERWLADRFRRSDAQWNLLAQSLITTSFLQRGPGGIKGHWTDAWDGYPATRDRMFKAMEAAKLSNPVVLSGDIHSFWANDIRADPRDPRSRALATEFVCTSITADLPQADPFASVQADNPNVRYFEREHHGYGVADLTGQKLDVRFRGIADRRDPSTAVSTLASFTVEAGRQEVIAAG